MPYVVQGTAHVCGQKLHTTCCRLALTEGYIDIVHLGDVWSKPVKLIIRGSNINRWALMQWTVAVLLMLVFHSYLPMARGAHLHCWYIFQICHTPACFAIAVWGDASKNYVEGQSIIWMNHFEENSPEPPVCSFRCIFVHAKTAAHMSTVVEMARSILSKQCTDVCSGAASLLVIEGQVILLTEDTRTRSWICAAAR
jgi:hypothetical protein